jgi:hypothetical protein
VEELIACGVIGVSQRALGSGLRREPIDVVIRVGCGAARVRHRRPLAGRRVGKAGGGSAQGRLYGTADPALTGALTGFVAGDAVTAAYSRTAGETVGSSPYSITAVLTPASVLGNYTITYNTAVFTINKAVASVTPAAASKTYGTADPA